MNYENEIRLITILKNIFYYCYLSCNIKSILLSVASTVMTFIGYNTSEKYVVIAGILNISSLMLLLLSYFFEKQMKMKVDYINELIKKNNELNSLEFNVNIPYPSLN